MTHSFSTHQLITVELTVSYESRMKEAHTYKRENYLNLTQEQRDAGHKAVVIPVEVGTRVCIGSSIYDLLTKLSICRNIRTNALALEMRGCSIRIRVSSYIFYYTKSTLCKCVSSKCRESLEANLSRERMKTHTAPLRTSTS